jgi:toxin FitB
MGTYYLLDTNIPIYLGKNEVSPAADAFLRQAMEPVIRLSVVSKIELLGYAFPTPSEQVWMETFIRQSLLFPITDPIVNQTILLRRKHKIKLPDLLIAATALVHGFTLVTNNTKDFAGIPGLALVNPFALPEG